jgi:retron-type reverse transcriptase
MSEKIRTKLKMLSKLVSPKIGRNNSPQSSRIVTPKVGKPNEKRPLGICNFEDKIVQKMMQKVLESIYEPLFLKCSYGFRIGISCHDAIKDLWDHLAKQEVNRHRHRS